jgi:hypothetical protein
MPTAGGSIRLFRIAGIDVFLHWSWFLIAIYEVQVWRSVFTSPIWAVFALHRPVRPRHDARVRARSGLPPGWRAG